MRFAVRLVLLTLVAVGLLAGTAGAKPDPDPNPRKKMDKLFTSPNMATNSDFAFWGNHVFSGYYTGDTGSPPGSGSRGGVSCIRCPTLRLRRTSITGCRWRNN